MRVVRHLDFVPIVLQFDADKERLFPLGRHQVKEGPDRGRTHILGNCG